MIFIDLESFYNNVILLKNQINSIKYCNKIKNNIK